MDFLKNLITELNDENTSIAADQKNAGEFSGFLDTGCYVLNGILSGSLYGGIIDNRISAIAGEEATGKTFFALSVVKNFLDKDPDNVVCYYDAEAAISTSMLKERGIDISRVIIAEPTTIQEFRHHVLKLLDSYEKKKDRPKMLLVLDSLGMLSTSKEVEDTAAGKETRDMTRAQVIRGTFRVITLRLARAKVPMLLTNHTYAVVGAYVPTKSMSGGGGLKYAASTILQLSKRKEREGTDVVGNIIKLTLDKGRFSKENSKAEVLLSYKTGLDKYYGLLDLAEKYNIVKKSGTRYELPDGRKVFGKFINENPEEVWTPDLMEQLEEAAHKEWRYGSAQTEETEIAVEEEEV